MRFDTYKQMFSNENLIACAGGNFTMLRPESDQVLRCEKCGKELTDDDPEDSVLCRGCCPEDDLGMDIQEDK